MIAPRALAQLVAASRLEETQIAIVNALATLMPGVKVIRHPGKLDIADVVAKSVVAAPGVAVGWTRIRTSRDVPGTFGTIVEWAAYVVAEDRGDTSTRTRMARDTVAHAIGAFLLEILHDPDASSWGLTKLSPALSDPAPEFRPIFTAKSFEGGTVYHAVTWSQALVDNGAPFPDGPDPDLALEEIGAAEFDRLPAEIVDAFRGVGEQP